MNKFEKIIVENNKNIHISIRDCGIGIPKENISKVFRITEGISTLCTNNEKGTGLGFILCKEFTEKHNGTISIESNLKVGSKISVLLPYK